MIRFLLKCDHRTIVRRGAAVSDKEGGVNAAREALTWLSERRRNLPEEGRRGISRWKEQQKQRLRITKKRNKTNPGMLSNVEKFQCVWDMKVTE